MKNLIQIVVLLLAPLSAFAQPQAPAKTPEAAKPYVEKQTGLSFPAEIGKLKFDTAKDFGDAKLGMGLRYKLPEAMSVDVIVYNLGLKTIPADPESAVLKDEVARAVGDMEKVAAQGIYSDLKIKSREIVPLSKAEGAPKVHKLLLTFSLRDQPRESCLYLLGYKNHFIKIRATWPPTLSATCNKELDGLLDWLAGAVKEK